MQIIFNNKTDKNILNLKQLTKIAKLVLKTEGQESRRISLGLFFVEDKEMQEINTKYREKEYTTDVITFRLIDNPQKLKINKKNFASEYDFSLKSIYIGEIFISVNVAETQAEEYKHSVEREVAELFVHGILHILGYDHEKEDEREIMRSREEIINSKLTKIVH